jgi:hypothetical protein
MVRRLSPLELPVPRGWIEAATLRWPRGRQAKFAANSERLGELDRRQNAAPPGWAKSTFVQGDRTLRLFSDPRPDSSVQKTTCFWQ